MSTYRRHYLYLAALLSICAALVCTVFTSWRLIEMAVSDSSMISALRLTWPGLAMAAWGLWGVHWFLAERAARPLTIVGAEERAAPVRKAYLYLAKFFSLLLLLAQAGLLVYAILRRQIGLPPQAVRLSWPAWPIALGAGMTISLVVWGYHAWTIGRDEDFGHEVAAAARWRRTYYYLAALIGYTLIVVGAAELLRSGLRLVARVFSLLPPAGAVWWEQGTVWLTALIVGVPFMVVLWRQIQHMTFAAPDVEISAWGRLIVRHSGALFGAAATLLSLVRLVQIGMMLLLRQSPAPPTTSWEGMLITPLAYLPVGLIAWLAFSGGIRIDLQTGGGGPNVLAAARFSRYLIAAVALVALSFGLAQLIRMVVLVALGMQPPDDIFAGWMAGGLSQAAAMVLVGAPAWWGHWWPRQVQARQPGRAGHRERSSFERTFYLYGILLAAALVILYNLAATVYNVVTASQTGIVQENNFISLLGSGAFAAIALGWWVAHALVIRGDWRWIAKEATAPTAAEIVPARPVSVGPPPAPAPSLRQYPRASLPLAGEMLEPAGVFDRTAAKWTVAVIDGGDGLVGAALLAGIQRDLPGAIVWPIGVSAVAHVTMIEALANRTPGLSTGDLNRVALIVGPCDILSPGGLRGEVSPQLAAAVASSPAKVLLLPPRDPRLAWVSAPPWPKEKWIEEAVRAAIAILTGV